MAQRRDVLARNDEDVRWRLRVDVSKGHDLRRLIDELHGDFLLGDFAEQTFVSHRLDLRDHLSVSAYGDRRQTGRLEPQDGGSQPRPVPPRIGQRADFIRLEPALGTEHDDWTPSASTYEK